MLFPSVMVLIVLPSLLSICNNAKQGSPERSECLYLAGIFEAATEIQSRITEIFLLVDNYG